MNELAYSRTQEQLHALIRQKTSTGSFEKAAPKESKLEIISATFILFCVIAAPVSLHNITRLQSLSPNQLQSNSKNNRELAIGNTIKVFWPETETSKPIEANTPSSTGEFAKTEQEQQEEPPKKMVKIEAVKREINHKETDTAEAINSTETNASILHQEIYEAIRSQTSPRQIERIENSELDKVQYRNESSVIFNPTLRSEIRKQAQRQDHARKYGQSAQRVTSYQHVNGEKIVKTQSGCSFRVSQAEDLDYENWYFSGCDKREHFDIQLPGSR